MTRTHSASAAVAMLACVAAIACENDEAAPEVGMFETTDVAPADSGTAYENCFNGRDDNGDHLVDCADVQCRALDACRTGQCPDGDLGEAVGMQVLRGTTVDASNDMAGSCGGNGGADLALTWTAPADGDYWVDTRWGSYDTVLYVREGACAGPELVCNDDAESPRALESEVVLSATAGETYVIVIDGYQVVSGADGGDFVLNVTPVEMDAEGGFCTDRRDNDDDLFADCADPDCATDPACLPLEGVRSVAAGSRHTCATAAAGDETWCWGGGSSGQLGDGSGSASSLPVALGQGWVALCAATRHTCGIDAEGDVSCWGDSWYGYTVDGDWGPTDVPVAVDLPSPAVAIDCTSTHTCAILDDGYVRCWGTNDYGQLGDGTTMTPSGASVPITDIGDVVSVAAGVGHTCTVRDNGEAWCVGLNNNGQLGAGPDWSYARPQRVTGIDDAVAVTAGANHTCILEQSGAVRCVGQNWQGQLGDGTNEQRRVVAAVRISPKVAQVDCGFQHCCAVDENADVWCWGGNGWGQLGTNDTGSRSTPVRVTLPWDVAAVAASEMHTCAVSTTGVVACWGGNDSGQLGDGTHLTQLLPTAVLSPR